jgi:two-component system, response regulator FlrC
MSRLSALIIEDDTGLREALTLTLSDAGFDVVTAEDGESGLRLLSECPIGLVVTDIKLPGKSGLQVLDEVLREFPGLPVLIMTAFGTIKDAVDAMRKGAADFLVKPFAADVLVNRVREFILRDDYNGDQLIAVDPEAREVFSLAAQVAKSDATVMISGESGTGKEILARFIHRTSSRSDGKFVAINCAAIPENMLEAMLFGYEKGAFTGALQAMPGKFEQAQGGTLLLDEISEMDIGLQAKILRVLQEREVERLGGRKTISLDVRVITTTNRRLIDEVRDGRFREDLYFRLNVFPLLLPPLRQRPGDIIPLAEYLLQQHARNEGHSIRRLSTAAREKLLSHNWPGNIRELDNLLLRALVLQQGDTIESRHLMFENYGKDEIKQEKNNTDFLLTTDSLNRNLKTHEHDLILEALRSENGSRKNAAKRLGISPRTLRYKLALMRDAGVLAGA